MVKTTSPLCSGSMLVVRIAALLCLLFSGGARPASADEDTVRVRLGYFDWAQPMLAACGRGWFNLAGDATSDRPTYEVECFPQTSGAFAASRLDNGDLDIASLGSSPWAEAVARGVDIKEVYVSSYEDSMAGIYVRNSEEGYAGIRSPVDLVNKTIATPFTSTQHYQLLFLIEDYGLQGQVKVIDLSPTKIIEAWDEVDRNPPIDGAACWGLATEHILANKGRELLPAGVFANWGAATYIVEAARRVFAKEHPKFMDHLVGIMSRLTDSFLDSYGKQDPRNAERWDTQNDELKLNYMASLVDALMLPGEDAGNPKEDTLIVERQNLDLNIYYTASTLLGDSCEYMGNNCNEPTGQHVAATNTAQFLFEQKSISALGILIEVGDDSCDDPSTFCGGDTIDPSYLSRSRLESSVGTPLGPYDAVVEEDDGSRDAVLTQLERLDNETGRSPFAALEIGRAEGDLTFGQSNCSGSIIMESLNGTIGDGANGLPGRSYSDEMHCKWTIYPRGDGLVEVRVQRLKLWSGDFVRIYSGGVPGCPGDQRRTLLAQLSGMYDENDALPPFRSSTCIVVEFKTDGNQERGYAIDESFGDGFEMFYSRMGIPEDDCNGNDLDTDGSCICNGTAWGGDCSHRSFCLGTSRVKVGEGTTHILQSSVYATKESLSSVDIYPIIGKDQHPYPNDLDCTYELDLGDTPYNLARVDIYYDMEDTFDLLHLRSGLDENSTYVVLSGRSSSVETFYLEVDEKKAASLHFTTDNKGRRRGFYAKVSGENSTRAACTKGQFGSRCELGYCAHRNTIQKEDGSGSKSLAGRVMSQDPNRSVRAMPWAPHGGCMWEIEADPDSTGKIRLNFTKPINLEPQTASGLGDRIIVDSLKDNLTVAVESCKSGETCGSTWQTGKCIEGQCEIHKEIELDAPEDNSAFIRLVTDKHDGGKNFSGFDFEVHYVQSCPASKCAGADFSCYNSLCTCPGGLACDCKCDEVQSNANVQSKARTAAITLGVAAAVALLLLIPFWFYRKRSKKEHRRQEATIARNSVMLKMQEDVIKRKEAELKVFTLGTSKFGNAVSFVDSLLKPDSPLTDPTEVQNLLLLKRCLLMRDDKMMHVPGNLHKDKANRYIMKEYAGVHNIDLLSKSSSTLEDSPATVSGLGGECLPEFTNLGTSQQRALCEILSLTKLRQWDFNVFDVAAIDKENTLLFVAWAILDSPHSQMAMEKGLGLNDAELNYSDGYNFADLDIKIEMGMLFDYVREIQKEYKDNPYHNRIHAADVVQTVHSLIQMAGDVFEREELFSILVSAVVHDVGHPGKNNAFQINTLSSLALTHNDAAVLENEHSSLAFKLMINGSPDAGKELNFLCHVKPRKFAEIRKQIVEAVLHTDMSQHFSTVASIKSQTTGKSWEEFDSKLRGKILMFMLHLADISNPAKDDPMFELWTDRCLDEFFAQGDEERKQGLPISPNCDRRETKKPDSQIGFINFVVKPAYGVLADIIPAVEQTILPVIEKNLLYWEEQKGKKETA